MRPGSERHECLAWPTVPAGRISAPVPTWRLPLHPRRLQQTDVLACAAGEGLPLTARLLGLGPAKTEDEQHTDEDDGVLPAVVACV